MSLSANIFRKRGTTPAEIQREAKVKKSLSSELSLSIKHLQQEHWSTGEAILSTDTANQVCNVLEAVFLHGLKNSVAKKIGKYVGLQNGEHADQSINFWSFATKFTHKDTTAQLTRLGQITTEIGLCRAWIRIALNDGLISSYVDSMLADKKTLQYFYHRLAYLVDFEHQEILKSLLKGIMILEFKLSYNSRVLNSWTNTPLILAGILENDDTPLPVVHSSGKPKTDELDNSRIHIKHTEGDAVKVIHGRKKSGSVKEPKTPPNTPFDVGNFTQGFTRQDVENLKRYQSGSSPQETECSSSSLISCPDPVKYNKNPVVYLENENKEDVMFTLNEEEDQAQDMFVSDDIESVIKRANDQVRRRISPVENWNGANDFSNTQTNFSQEFDSPVTFSVGSLEVEHHEQNVNSANNIEYDLTQKNQMNGDDIGNHSRHGDIVDHSRHGDIVDHSHHGDIVDHSRHGDVVDHSRDDHHARILSDILNDNSIINHDTRSSPDHSDSGIVNSPSSNSTSATTSPVTSGVKIKGSKPNLKPDFSASKHESAPEISPAVANSIETSKMKYSKHRYSLPNIRVFRNSPQNSSTSFRTISESHASNMRPRSEDDTGADDTVRQSPSSFGNSLGAASGWSSSFNIEEQDTIDKLPETRKDKISTQYKTRADSFGTLLQNYTPTSSVTSPTLDDVLNDLPVSPDMSPMIQHRIYEVEDDMILIEDFEVAPSMSDVISQSKLAVLGEIANEKGLDAQNYQCKGCTRPVGLIYGKPRVCSFDAWYYCFECHENDDYYIPALVIHNWDFRKHPVAKCNYKFLRDIEDQAKLDISKINPKLYEHVNEMADLKVARTQLYYLKTYLYTCKQSIADEFRQSLWPREYFYENIHIYSLSDFLQVPSGTLLQSLKKVIKFATKHVYECRLCSQKGYICELCNQAKVIYPFEIESTVRCKQCKSVFHKTCKIEGKSCPKCLRKQQRRSQMGSEPETPDSQDYAFVPL